MDITQRAAATIQKHSMIAGGESVLVGLSGGPDSVCLLLTLDALREDLCIKKIHTAYVDHGLRPDETPIEVDSCRELCKSLGVGFVTKTVDVQSSVDDKKLNLQEVARTLRLGALEEAAAELGCERVALGHNLDDQAETFLLRILRGSGPRGAAGIPPARGVFIRPLIEISRSDIEGFLKERGQKYLSDSSNLKGDYQRNWLRAKVMPLLLEINPSVTGTIARTADIFREEDRYLEAEVTKALMRLISRKTDTSVELFLVPLETMDRVLARRVIRRAMDSVTGLRGVSFTHVESVLGLIKDGTAGDSVDLPRGIRAVKKYATLLLTGDEAPSLGVYSLSPGQSVALDEANAVIEAVYSDGGEVLKDRQTIVLDADKLSLPLTVRQRKPGDYFYPEGFGKKKKLQDFFVDEKVPREERDVVPVVASGEDVVWVAGMRADGRFAADDSTKKALVLTLKRPGR